MKLHSNDTTNHDDLFITQHVTFPTRYRNDQTPSVLDLILSTDQHEVTDRTSLPPLGKSDYVVISFEFCVITL